MRPIPEVGDRAPELALPDQTGEVVRLSDQVGRIVVLAFYPADWSPVCTGELSLFQEVLDDVRARNAVIFGISTDGVWCHRFWAQDQHLSFQLLSDFWPHGRASQDYGVLQEGDGTSWRSLFFVDRQGLVSDSWIAEDIDVAPGIDVLLDGMARIDAGASLHA